jgi:membrane protein DedA with SNARE-associated domain
MAILNSILRYFESILSRFDLLQFVDILVARYSYFGYFVFGLFNFVIPSEPVLISAGFLGEQGRLNLFWVLLAALCGSFIKTSIIYSLGYFFGKQFLIKYSRWTGFKEEYMQYMKNKIAHYGYRIVVPLQFVPYVRRFLGAPSGILKLSFWRFMYYNMIGVSLWFSFLMTIGWFFGKSYKKIPAEFKVYLDSFVWLVLAGFFALFLYEVIKHFKTQKDTKKII